MVKPNARRSIDVLFNMFEALLMSHQFNQIRQLRLVQSDVLNTYLTHLEFWSKVGNHKYSLAVSNQCLPPTQKYFNSNWVLYHSWRNEMYELDDEDAKTINMITEQQFDESHTSQRLLSQLEKVGWYGSDSQDVDIDKLVWKSQNVFAAIQNPYELKVFLEIFRDREAKNVVEIGTARGGLLYCLSQLALPAAHFVSIDLPGSMEGGAQTLNDLALFRTFFPEDQEVDFISGDSTSRATIDQLSSILKEKKLDLLFIDGDHSYDGCKLDFENYSKFMSPDGMIVFHDICGLPAELGEEGGVGKFWLELSEKYPVQEIIDPNGVAPHLPLRNGERWKFGIGIINAKEVLTR